MLKGYDLLLGFVCLNVDRQELSPEVQFLPVVLSHRAATALWVSVAGCSTSVFAACVPCSHQIH